MKIITSPTGRKGILAVFILVALVYVFSNPLKMFVVTRIIRHRLAAMNRPLDDGLHAGLCGTGTPLADITRAGPCIAVFAGSRMYVVDVGDGSTRNINLMGFPAGKIDAVLLTHFHSDHIAGLGELMLQRWAGGSRKEPLDVIGPPGVETVVEGFNTAFSLDRQYRTTLHSRETLPPSGAGGRAAPFALGPEEDASAVVLRADGLTITAFKVDHKPVVPAVGYRFDYKGRSLVISGDTVSSPSLLTHARGADILFHEAMSPWMMKMIREESRMYPFASLKEVSRVAPLYHSSPEDAAKIAAGAGVRQLVLYHIIPPLPSRLVYSLFLNDAHTYFRGPITMGRDGMLFSLPPGSSAIHHTSLM